MKHLPCLSLAVFATVLCAAAPPVTAASAGRERILFDAGWRFQQDAPMKLTDTAPVTVWRWKPAADAVSESLAAPGIDTNGEDWKTVDGQQDLSARAPGIVWIRTILPASTRSGRVLRFDAVDDRADVYLNGKMLLRHDGWNDSFDVPLDSAWNSGGQNVIAVRIKNDQGPGGLGGPVTFGYVTGGPAQGARPDSESFNDKSWRTVHLPHDYVVEGTFSPQGDTSHGSLIPTKAWYRKTFTLPASDKGRSLWIDFDGVYRNAKVTLNGQELGGHACGYTSFRFDITKAAHYGGKNVLAVYVDAKNFEGWWYEGGGIYRHVWLNKADTLHVAPWGTFVASDVKDVLGKPSATLSIKMDLTNLGSAPRNGAVVTQVFDPSNRLVGSATTPASVAAQKDVQVTSSVSVPVAQLWSIEKPQLYRLHTEVRQGNRVVDSVDTPFGIRTIRFDAEKGFFLNEKAVKIKGTCNHQDFAGVGVAVPDSLEYWRVRRLKSMGSNAWRMSHNPPTPELLDACDKLGMLVMDENRHLGDTENGKAGMDTPFENLSEVESMVRRDRNHPSIILWSMCNEEGIQGSEHGKQIFTAMRNAVLKYDTTRPVSAAMNGGFGNANEGFVPVEDLQGINYNPGAYDWFHKMLPSKPLYGSETASQVSTRGIYSTEKFTRDGVTYIGEPDKGYVSAYDSNAPGWAQTAENAWRPIGERDYVAGGFVWTGFDYKGETTPFGWPCVNSHFGILDMCGFAKDSYWFYQAWWGDKPMAHVFPHWNWAGKEGQTIPVWAYTNAASAELFVNGKSLGTQPMPRFGHVQWDVPYAPGKVEVRGYDAAGKVIASDAVETTGAPAGIKLVTDRQSIAADGEDLTVIEVQIVDAQGRVVAVADNLVSFKVTGPAQVVGVGNGDPTSHEPDKGTTRHAFNGLCAVLVGASEKSGAVRLTATSPGLTDATLELKTK